MSDLQKAALQYAQHGLRVFPLKPLSKDPATTHGFKDATTDEKKIRAWWDSNPAYNIGVATGAGLAVVDVDVKDGKDGWASLRAAGVELPAAAQSRVRTPTGGYHVYFKTAAGEVVNNRQGGLAHLRLEGVDVRGDGGYIVAPPSRTEKGEYGWVGPMPWGDGLAPWSSIVIPAPPPPPPPPPPKSPVAPSTMGDKAGVLERARKYLATMPGAVQGQRGSDATFRAASVLVNGFALSDGDALRLLLDEYNTRCTPPWTEKELRHKVADAATKQCGPGGEPYGWLAESAWKPEVRGGALDGRALTSPQNGTKGGRPSIDNTAVAEAFKMHYKTNIVWRKEGFYEYDSDLGAYRLRTEKEEGARVADFLNRKPEVDGICVRYSKGTAANVLGSLGAAANLDLAPPCFLDTGESAVRWAAMRNGLLDIGAAARGESVTLRPFTSNFFSLRSFPFVWNPTATCPKFMHFLAEAVPDEESRDMMRKLFGYLLTPDTSKEVFFVFYGPPGCGKSTAQKILRKLLGAANTCSVPFENLGDRFSQFPLTATLANIVGETLRADVQNLGAVEETLKKIVSGDNISTERKGMDVGDAPATARIVLAANPPLPYIMDRSGAVVDRMRLIVFPNRFRGTDAHNPKLAEEITDEELPGVFAWAVSGMGDLLREKTFPQSPSGAAIIGEHAAVCDRERTFLLDRYEQDEEDERAFVPAAEIYQDYLSWYEGEGFKYPKSKPGFSQDVVRVFPQVRKNERRFVDKKLCRGFVGLKKRPIPKEGDDAT